MDSSKGSSASAQRVDSSAADIADLGDQSPPSITPEQVRGAGVTFGEPKFFGGSGTDHDEDDDKLDDLDDPDSELPPIEVVVVSEGTTVSHDLVMMIWNLNFAIGLINAFISGETGQLGAEHIARALRNYFRFRIDQYRKSKYHIKQFLRRTLTTFKKLSSTFDPMHQANLVTLLSLGFGFGQASKILTFFNGPILTGFDGSRNPTPRIRMCWFWVFINLRMKTEIFESEAGYREFFKHASDPRSNPLSPQYHDVAQEAFADFNSQVPPQSDQSSKKAKAQGSGTASVAGSKFSTMTAVGGFLWKYHAALTAASKLLTAWLAVNACLRDERTKLTEQALIHHLFRLLSKLQCSSGGDFNTEREFSSEIYEKLMKAFWNSKKSGKRFRLRFLDTFSSILCATGNYDAAYEWLRRALECKHSTEKADPTEEEVGVLQFAFISISVGINSLRSCNSQTLGSLFVHIFFDEEFEVDLQKRAQIEASIARVTEDFETEPVFQPRRVPKCDRPEAGEAQSEHGMSESERNRAFERMLREAKSNPQKKGQLAQFLKSLEE
jgi:hypothetical protein